VNGHALSVDGGWASDGSGELAASPSLIHTPQFLAFLPTLRLLCDLCDQKLCKLLAAKLVKKTRKVAKATPKGKSCAPTPTVFKFLREVAIDIRRMTEFALHLYPQRVRTCPSGSETVFPDWPACQSGRVCRSPEFQRSAARPRAR